MHVHSQANVLQNTTQWISTVASDTLACNFSQKMSLHSEVFQESLEMYVSLMDQTVTAWLTFGSSKVQSCVAIGVLHITVTGWGSHQGFYCLGMPPRCCIVQSCGPILCLQHV